MLRVAGSALIDLIDFIDPIVPIDPIALMDFIDPIDPIDLWRSPGVQAPATRALREHLAHVPRSP